MRQLQNPYILVGLAFVYFDVSGSVAEEVPSVAQTLLPYCRSGLCTVHVFSTVVHPACP